MSKNIDPSSSLELLLDTICNTFGGIIFIAILTAILLQLSGKPGVVQADASAANDKTIQQATIAAQRDALSRAISQQEKLLRQFNVSEGQMELAQLEQLRTTKERLIADMNARLATIADQEKEAGQATARSRESEDELTTARRRLAELETQLELKRKSHSREAKLPKLHGTQKREVPVFLVQQRLCFLVLPDRFRSINHDDFDITDEANGGKAVQLKAGHGTPLQGRSRLQIAKMIAGFNHDEEYLAVFVTADSFDVFSEFRAAMFEHSFEYRLVPMTKSEPLHTGSAKSLVQ